jgi:hypothetical protein
VDRMTRSYLVTLHSGVYASVCAVLLCGGAVGGGGTGVIARVANVAGHDICCGTPSGGEFLRVQVNSPRRPDTRAPSPTAAPPCARPRRRWRHVPSSHGHWCSHAHRNTSRPEGHCEHDSNRGRSMTHLQSEFSHRRVEEEEDIQR